MRRMSEEVMTLIDALRAGHQKGGMKLGERRWGIGGHCPFLTSHLDSLLDGALAQARGRRGGCLEGIHELNSTRMREWKDQWGRSVGTCQ